MNDLHRVFLHEVGHFIAHELNVRLGKGGETKSIFLEPFALGMDLYIGEAKINKPGSEDEKYIPSREELSYYLASSTYGCIVQAYYLNESLRESQDKNGGDDLKKWFGALMQHHLEDFNADIHEIDITFLDHLVQRNALTDIIKLDPDSYLTQKGNAYEVDLEKLRKDTQQFVDSHKKEYEELISLYEAAFSTALLNRN